MHAICGTYDPNPPPFKPSQTPSLQTPTTHKLPNYPYVPQQVHLEARHLGAQSARLALLRRTARQVGLDGSFLIETCPEQRLSWTRFCFISFFFIVFVFVYLSPFFFCRHHPTPNVPTITATPRPHHTTPPPHVW